MKRTALFTKLNAPKLVLSFLFTISLSVAIAYFGVNFRASRPFTLPAPTGSNEVGRQIEVFRDSDRQDPFNPNQKRELLVFLWYPVQKSANAPLPYLPVSWAKEHDRRVGWGEQRFQTSVGHSHADKALSSLPAKFPLLLLSPGLGQAPNDYSALAEDLASHGYIVLGVTPSYSADLVVFPDGRVVPSVLEASTLTGDDTSYKRAAEKLLEIWQADLRFALNRMQELSGDSKFFLGGRIDFSRVGAVGHSFGGASATEAAQRDPRIRAVVNLDGRLFGEIVKSGTSKPLLCLWSDDGNLASFAPLDEAMFDALRIPGKASIERIVLGSQHMDFTDAPFRWSIHSRSARSLGRLKAERMSAIVRAATRAFLDQHLSESSAPSQLENFKELQEYPQPAKLQHAKDYRNKAPVGI